jgi:hypothetical protein
MSSGAESALQGRGGDLNGAAMTREQRGYKTAKGGQCGENRERLRGKRRRERKKKLHRGRGQPRGRGIKRVPQGTGTTYR